MAERTVTEKIEAEKRQLLSMKQHQDALASGDMTEEDLERMAIARVQTGKTSGRRPRQTSSSSQDHGPRLEHLGSLYRFDGQPLLSPESGWIAGYSPEEPGSFEPDLPTREYQVHVMKHGGRRFVAIALDWEPA